MIIAGLALFAALFFTTYSSAECRDGKCADGYKTDKTEDGVIFRGYSKSSKHGQGTMKWPNGDEYVGEWKNDKMDGQGTMTWANGDVYEGEWKDDIMNGQGTYIWANGDEYSGYWKNGEQDGEGAFTSADGEVFAGLFRNGEMSR
ncbi:MAG: hypothetical protein HZC49_06735 [Nitrospirae bacterium]|nr:hypothetical protein [Nitrospirota bacterium]